MTTICVVDDDLSVRRSLTNLLRSAGYHAVSYESGEGFLSSEERNHASCLLLDLRLSGLQGIEVQRELNSSHNTELAVICMSAHWDDASLREARALGAAECLRKPFTSDVLLEAINRAIRVPPSH